MIQLDPVAYFFGSSTDKPDVPRQGSLGSGNCGVIRFLPGKNYEQALEDLKGMDRIWVLFWMHKVSSWRPKIQPPRSVSKKGVFATRSPHRPNPIGLSCVKLVGIQGLNLLVESHDLLDETPVLDVKPYLEYADSFSGVASGWLDHVGVLSPNNVCFSSEALEQISFFEKEGIKDMKEKIEERLRFFTQETDSNRIEKLFSQFYVLAYKSWRVIFRKEEGVEVLFFFSGYDNSVLAGDEESRWGDVFLHRKFIGIFSKKIESGFFSIRLQENANG